MPNLRQIRTCSRCRLLKIRCDKTKPSCERCNRAKVDCSLRSDGLAQAIAASVPNPLVIESNAASRTSPMRSEPSRLFTSWRTRRRGTTHWKALIARLEISALNIGQTFVHAEDIRILDIDCSTDILLPSNFPFNSPGAIKYSSSLEKVRNLIYSHRDSCDAFVDAYLALYQPVHPILDPPHFLEDINCFWEDAAQTDLCLAAESCLARTTFMVRPSISVMRTFCLMVLAKQLANGTCWSFDASWSLLGIIVRLAVCIGLHKPPVATPKSIDDHAVTVSEWQSGHILWITIVYFCIQTAAITARVNRDGEKPSYDEILQYNADIKRLMTTTLEHPRCGHPSLRAVLDIFFRRILLVLHRCHALRTNAPTLHPVSYWASLECSLAILVHHRDLCEHVGNPDNRDLLGRLFKLDFFAAALTAGLHLLQADAPLADGFSIPPRQTILETLETCTEIWGRDKESVQALLISP
ncbi:hypothetical protein BBK36DRAFT_1173189 [Trichoderma citrinoviride]|uniref:Zn(2)-C6 fungal-type domain-containing protein n=1 Tax=Trichoderma citrinoviride TaxID=58853 RepID=A0A2T4AXB8_9HYPO|nr:hypothetical protein BBK36DRAFT_1173189 [Trichoderma citrinoviride]PTB61722.1 hypothetical protein BBK36DRAFT_1173189 [Trichoderma citrinoviride]